MSKPKNIDESLLAKYLGGEATEQDLLDLDLWLGADTANTLELDRYRKIWDTKTAQGPTFEPNVDLAWQKVASRINKPSPSITIKQNHFRRNFSIAASVIMLLGVGLYFYFIQKKVPVYQTIVSKNTGLQKLLEDSSSVYLNQNTSLQYPEQFSNTERRVKLIGEAFFDIKPNAEKPFNIEVGKLNIKVLGTSFNVDEDSLNITIIVRTGRVEVAKSETEKEILSAGEGLVYDKSKNAFHKNSSANPSEFAYFNKVFVFNNTSLAEVSRLLSKGYNAQISVGSKDLNQMAITTKFENISLPEALQIITETLQLNLKTENNSYVFVKK